MFLGYVYKVSQEGYMIRIAIAAIAIALSGCATNNTTPSASLHALTETCAKERGKMIRAEWHNFEFSNWAEIPNGWKQHSHRWAKEECEFGRKIKAYHPQPCQRGSIMRCRR